MSSTLRTAITIAAATALLAAPIAASARQAAGAPAQRPAAGVFGCAATGNQQEIGAVVGGLAGAAIGNAVGRDNRTVGILVGGALGAAAGSWIGCRLQIADQQKAQAALQRALVENSSQSWRSEIGAASGSVDVLSTQMVQVSGPGFGAEPVNAPGLPPFPMGVMQLTNYDMSPRGIYTARSRANLRAGPGTSNAVVGQLVAGETVEVLAGVPGQPWVLVGSPAGARGYVAASLLRGGPVTNARTAAAVPTRPCRMLRETIDGIGDAPQVSMYRGCQNADGSWSLNPA